MSDGSKLARTWFVLALTALGLSALFALFLVLVRLPFFGSGAAWFRTALVLHVNLAVTVWFGAMAGGLWSLHANTSSHLRWAAFWLALVGTLAMLLTLLTGNARPVLSNYTPLLDHPLFLMGLILFGSGVALCASLVHWRQLLKNSLGWQAPAILAALALLAALCVVLLDIFQQSSKVFPAVGADSLLWGLGHSLQFVHILMLMAAWLALGKTALAALPIAKPLLPWLLCLALLPVLAGPVIALLYPAGSGESHQYFSSLMRWGTWPAAAGLSLLMVWALWRVHQLRALSSDEWGLALSIVLFAVGCGLGASIRGDTLVVPGHYHATVGSVTLAYLLWLRQLAPALGLPAPLLASSNRAPLLYGLGILILAAGLAYAGSLGIARKSPQADLSFDSSNYWLAMGTASVGGLLALLALLRQVYLSLRAAYQASRPSNRSRKDVRIWALASVVLVVVIGGWLVQMLPGNEPGLEFKSADPELEALRAQRDLRFQQGVVMLHAKQYEHALSAFGYVMKVAPKMPEAYVNAGFALLGLKRFAEALDYFDYATQLRTQQLNAYYGMAVALEGIGDMRGAIGAMQSYVHLAKADDPYRIKAEAALWEWREALRLKAK